MGRKRLPWMIFSIIWDLVIWRRRHLYLTSPWVLRSTDMARWPLCVLFSLEADCSWNCIVDCALFSCMRARMCNTAICAATSVCFFMCVWCIYRTHHFYYSKGCLLLKCFRTTIGGPALTPIYLRWSVTFLPSTVKKELLINIYFILG